ncbi:MAG: VOC family protein [Ruthenibacterium lactatiformans]
MKVWRKYYEAEMCEYCDAKPLRNEPILLAGTGPALPAARSNRFEIPAGGAFVVITHSDTKTPVNPDCCGLEFAVDDVDAEYERLLSAGVSVERPPVTYPWGVPRHRISRSGRQ